MKLDNRWRDQGILYLESPEEYGIPATLNVLGYSNFFLRK